MAGTRAQAPLRFRTRKLVPKQPLPVIREDEIQSEEYKELLEHTETIATGVEQSEESEYHLQQALLAQKGKKSKDAPKIVPAPPALDTTAINYDVGYSTSFSQPHSYIRFSSTVEECTGCQYNMTTDDETWLKGYNLKRQAISQCSDDDFEKLMEYFEYTADVSAPMAYVDGTVVPYETMQEHIAEEIDEKARIFAKDIYEYWKTRRQCESNRPLQPSLKFEVSPNDEDSDPYVCFRRRDVRQTRKTRNRDVQSTEKLKKLRKELEDGRLLVLESHQYQLAKRDQIKQDRKIFEQRAKVRDIRLRLGIRCEDEDLVLQKVQKRKLPDPMAAITRAPGALRTVAPIGGRPIESELVQYSDQLMDRSKQVQAIVDEKVRNHQRWNQEYIDVTREPLSEVDLHPNFENGFRTAHAQYLITPPASMDGSQDDRELSPSQFDFALAKFAGVSEDTFDAPKPSYRRRVGRNNRMWIDRRGLKPSSYDGVDKDVLDRWKYDSDDEDDPPVYEVDPYDTRALKYRATIPFPRTLPSNTQYPQPAVNGAINNAAPRAAVGSNSQVTQPT